VTDTFVNRHHSLPFVGAAQHVINVSELLGQSDFAERRYGISAGSLRPDVRRPDHLAPFLGVVGDELAEVGR
jgi:hypothetical protein